MAGSHSHWYRTWSAHDFKLFTAHSPWCLDWFHGPAPRNRTVITAANNLVYALTNSDFQWQLLHTAQLIRSQRTVSSSAAIRASSISHFQLTLSDLQPMITSSSSHTPISISRPARTHTIFTLHSLSAEIEIESNCAPIKNQIIEIVRAEIETLIKYFQKLCGYQIRNRGLSTGNLSLWLHGARKSSWNWNCALTQPINRTRTRTNWNRASAQIEIEQKVEKFTLFSPAHSPWFHGSHSHFQIHTLRFSISQPVNRTFQLNSGSNQRTAHQIEFTAHRNRTVHRTHFHIRTPIFSASHAQFQTLLRLSSKIELKRW